jgi:peptidoglycan/LPS O-acetylase OafA/YrhL
LIRETKGHFEVLDGLRGVAALAVLIGHSYQIFVGPNASIMPHKNLAVAFFFALSGFVIAGAYDQRLRDGMPLAEFMRRRVIRLYPMILVACLIGVVYLAVVTPDFWSHARTGANIIGGILAVPTPPGAFSFGSFPINPPEWSLFNEMLAYLVYGLLFARLRTAKIIFLGLASFVIFAGMALVSLHGRSFADSHSFVSSLFETAAMFSVGVALWRSQRLIESIRFKTPTWLLAALIIAPCIAPRAWGGAIDVFAMGVVIPAVLILGAARGKGGGHPVEHLLGALSFPVYILHWTVVMIASQILPPRIGVTPSILIVTVVVPIYAWVMLKWVDEPLRAWLSAKTAPKRSAADSPLAT